MNFLNQNAAAIQALTATIITGLTGWLIYWTRRYARTSERVALIMEQDIHLSYGAWD